MDAVAPLTADPLEVRRGGRVRVDMRTRVDFVGASIRGGRRDLDAVARPGSKRRLVIRLPRRLGQQAVLELFARYPQGDATFGARLALR